MSTEPTVFIVEDDSAICERVELLAKSVQLRAESYTSANKFLENYNQKRPGCLITDVRMPGMSGLELLEKLAAETPLFLSLSLLVMAIYQWLCGL